MSEANKETIHILPALDGKVYEGEELNEAMVEFDPTRADDPICITGGHGHYEIDAVFLNVKQALSLLELLKQLEPTLKQKIEEAIE